MSKKKPVLKMKTETIHEVKYHDFEEFVKKIYPELKDYSFVETQECGNDSVHRFHAADGDWDEYAEKDWPKVRNYTLFSKLVLDGHLQEGVYVVDVCW